MGTETAPVYRAGEVRTIRRGRVLVFHRNLRPIEARLIDVRKRRDWKTLRADVESVRAGEIPIRADGYRTDIETQRPGRLAVDDDDIEIPQASPGTAIGPAHFEQMQVLLEQLVARVVTLENHVAKLDKSGGEPASEDCEPAPWVMYPPPVLTGDPHADVRAFVEYYNTVYIGRSDGRAQRIPACWEEHPGLATEIANLAATWRAANIGPRANPRDAHVWHHQWSPGTIN